MGSSKILLAQLKILAMLWFSGDFLHPTRSSESGLCVTRFKTKLQPSK